MGVGRATAKSMVLNLVLVHIIGAAGQPDLLGQTPGADREGYTPDPDVAGEPGGAEEEYRYHSGEAGRRAPDAIEFIDVHKSSAATMSCAG